LSRTFLLIIGIIFLILILAAANTVNVLLRLIKEPGPLPPTVLVEGETLEFFVPAEPYRALYSIALTGEGGINGTHGFDGYSTSGMAISRYSDVQQVLWLKRLGDEPVKAVLFTAVQAEEDNWDKWLVSEGFEQRMALIMLKHWTPKEICQSKIAEVAEFFGDEASNLAPQGKKIVALLQHDAGCR
jgi:hypothetical protein